MPTDQNQADEFNSAVALAENRKQEAIRAANDRFDADRAATLKLWGDAVQAAQAFWDAVKGNPDDAGHNAAQAATESLRSSPPDYRQARDNLAAAVRAADDAYNAEVAALREQHGVTAVPAGARP